jgi:hypothetical protein
MLAFNWIHGISRYQSSFSSVSILISESDSKFEFIFSLLFWLSEFTVNPAFKTAF